MKIKNFIVMLIAASFFMTLFYAENVRGAVAYIKIDDFDTYGAGVTSGSNAYWSWIGTSGKFTVQATTYHDAPNSLRIAKANPAYCFFNFTNNMSYTGFDFWFRTATGFQSYINMYFYNDTDVELIHLFFENSPQLDFEVYNYATSTMNVVWDSMPEQTWYQIGMSANYTVGVSPINSIYYYIKNSTGVIQADAEIPTRLSGEWGTQKLHRILFSVTLNVDANYAYFDLFNLTAETFQGDLSSNDLSNYTAICSGGSESIAQVPTFVVMEKTIGWCPLCWKESYTESVDNKYIESQFISPISRTIYAVDLFIGAKQLTDVSDSLTDYFMVLNGINWGTPKYILQDGTNYKLRWTFASGEKLTNEKPLFEFYSVASSTSGSHWEAVGLNSNFAWSTSHFHGTDANFGNGIYDGFALPGGTLSLCYYYNASLSSTPCENCEEWMPEFTQKFGNDFIQFLHYDDGCYYGLDYNKNPIIIYNLTDLYTETGSRCYVLEMYKVGSTTPIYWRNINIPDNVDFAQGIETCTDYTFTATGQYYLKLYNTSNYCSTLESVIGNGGNPSMPITVCSKTSNPPSDSGGQTGIGNFDFSGLPIFFKIICALVLIIVLTITPYALASMINRGRVQIEMPSLVYVAFFFIGVVASVLLGFLDAWVFFIILLGLVITFAVLWIQKKGGGET